LSDRGEADFGYGPKAKEHDDRCCRPIQPSFDEATYCSARLKDSDPMQEGQYQGNYGFNAQNSYNTYPVFDKCDLRLFDGSAQTAYPIAQWTTL
jgi:hypothetical protein